MKQFVCVSILAFIGLFSKTSYAIEIHRNGNIVEREWSAGKPKVFGLLGTPPSNNNDCSANETGGDKALTFDISTLANLAGSSFDVNKIYVDGIGSGGDYALNVWLGEWFLHIHSFSLQWLVIGNDWNTGFISICVGSAAQNLSVDIRRFGSIVLWYDGPVSTPNLSFPVARPAGDPMNMGKSEDSLAVSGNGNTISSFNGSGTATHETEPPNNGKPDFIVNKVWLTNANGGEQYAYNITDEIKMNAELKNTGDDDVPSDDYVHTRFYLSRGYKEDPHSEWVRVGTDETLGSHLDPGETHSEQEGLKLWNQDIVQPGKVYNVVVCTDRIADQSNGSGDWIEKHESNNCSTPSVFTVNGSFDFTMSSLALGGGKISLNVGETFSVSASAYNAGSNSPRELRVGYFLSGGAIQGEVLLGTHIVTEAEFVSGFTKTLSLSGLVAPITNGMYTIKACVDYDERTQETNEGNNCIYTTFNVVTPVVLDPSPKKTSSAILNILFNN